ncbi:MAG TPA: pseudouridine synthase [Treponemataceae bacterium]|nr:pseudouridine synthase [Treponemataceae bacterium]
MKNHSLRIDKLLSGNGFGSRRDIKRLLHSCSLTINGAVCADAATRVDPLSDRIEIDGEPVVLREFHYLMLNKPSGVITSTRDPDHATVMDLLSPPWSRMELFPVGRLDVDTEGLILLTDDGPLGHRLTSPKTGVDKTYYVRLRDQLDDDLFEQYRRTFETGVSFKDGYQCLPARLARAPGGNGEVLLTIQEGKYHQVKKMFKAVGNEVAFLKRVSMGPLILDPLLESGQWRELAENEIAALKNASACNGESENDR